MTSRSTTTNTYAYAPPPPPHPPPPYTDNPHSSTLTHRNPFESYDYFFSMFDDDADDHRHFENPVSPLSNNFRITHVTRTVTSDPRVPFEGAIVVARPPRSAGSIAPPGSLIHSLLFDNPRTRHILGGQWTTTASPRQEADSRLTYNEQKRALQKLRKEIYNPFRRLSPTVNLYYRGTAAKESEAEKNNNGKSCAICLEDFERKQEVMLTPCNHMFHEECIVPWIKSNGRCPVCRFGISD